MKVLFDARTMRENPTGVGHTAFNLLKELEKDKNLEIIVLTRKGVRRISGLTRIKIHETGINYQFVGLKRFLFEQTILPLIIRKYNPDITHFYDSFGVPYLISKKRKIVLTVHDLIPMTKYRELMTDIGSIFYKLSIKHSLLRADKIICISQFTKKDIGYFFPKVKRQKIKNIYHGAQKPIKSNTDKNIILRKLNIKNKYIFYLGGFPPRKNVYGLVKAFYIFNKKHKNKYKLILAGRFSPLPDAQKNIKRIKSFIKSNNLENKIILSDCVSVEEKEILLRNSEFCVYLSFYEGFGLPVLEALSVGTPVLTSMNSPMEELAQGYALYANPSNVNDISDKMSKLINNYNFYKQKAEEAKNVLIPKFNWRETARQYQHTYNELTNN